MLYENNQYINLTTDEEYHFTFLADKLKGVDEFIGPIHKYGLTDSKELHIIFFRWWIGRIQWFFNDELKIDYDRLESASIDIGLTHKNEYISFIELRVRWTKKEGYGENSDISYTLINTLSFIHDGVDYKKEYERLKNSNLKLQY